MTSGQLYLRQSRARSVYTCEHCRSVIPRGAPYYRHEPHPMARYHRGERVRYFCYVCVQGKPAGSLWEAPATVQRQLELPFGGQAIVRPTHVLVVDITDELVLKQASYGACVGG